MGLRVPGSCSLGSSEVGSSHDSGFAISMLGPADTVGAPQLLSPDGAFLPLCHPGSPCGVCGPENCPPHCEADAVSTAQQQRHSWLSPTVCSDAHQALESRTAQRQHRHRVGIPRSPRSVVGPPPPLCRGLPALGCLLWRKVFGPALWLPVLRRWEPVLWQMQAPQGQEKGWVWGSGRESGRDEQTLGIGACSLGVMGCFTFWQFTETEP